MGEGEVLRATSVGRVESMGTESKNPLPLGLDSTAFRLWEFGRGPVPCAWPPYQQGRRGGFLCRCVEDCSGVRCNGFFLCSHKNTGQGPLSSLDTVIWVAGGPHIYKRLQLRAILNSALTTSGCGHSHSPRLPKSTQTQNGSFACK